jgi:hypothetical protein
LGDGFNNFSVLPHLQPGLRKARQVAAVFGYRDGKDALRSGSQAK